jgi:hypothetical protein
MSHADPPEESRDTKGNGHAMQEIARARRSRAREAPHA